MIYSNLVEDRIVVAIFILRARGCVTCQLHSTKEPCGSKPWHTTSTCMNAFWRSSTKTISRLTAKSHAPTNSSLFQTRYLDDQKAKPQKSKHASHPQWHGNYHLDPIVNSTGNSYIVMIECTHGNPFPRIEFLSLSYLEVFCQIRHSRYLHICLVEPFASHGRRTRFPPNSTTFASVKPVQR